MKFLLTLLLMFRLKESKLRPVEKSMRKLFMRNKSTFIRLKKFLQCFQSDNPCLPSKHFISARHRPDIAFYIGCRYRPDVECATWLHIGPISATDIDCRHAADIVPTFKGHRFFSL